MSNDLVITEYDPRWPGQFEELRARLSSLLGEMAAAIEHVGSTAVPGMAAKPIIDLDILLADAGQLPAAIHRLATLGYQHQGDLGIPGREAFGTPPGPVTHHLYVCPPGSAEFRRHVVFRDYLRSHPDTVALYSEVKRALVASFGNDRAAYIEGKEAFVKDLVGTAMNEAHART